MLWVLAAIGCFVVVHTVVNVAYRKPGPAHEPAAEARERQRTFVKGDLKGWTRYAVRIQAAGAVESAAQSSTSAGTASVAGTSADITRAPAPENLATALPFDLVGIFTTDPRLHAGPAVVHAPAALEAAGEMRLFLRYASAAAPDAFGEALAFAKDQHLCLFLQDETRPAFEQPPTPFAYAIELALPPNVLGAGPWKASLYTRDALFEWSFNVE